MRERLIAEADGLRTYVLVFAAGEEALAGLRAFARDAPLSAASFTAIGAFSEATLAYFDWERKEYEEIPVTEQVEVLSLVGDVALEDGDPQVHAHVVVGTRSGEARGGHLLAGTVRPTLEVVLTESAAHLRKRFDPESGLTLIDPDFD